MHHWHIVAFRASGETFGNVLLGNMSSESNCELSVDRVVEMTPRSTLSASAAPEEKS